MEELIRNPVFPIPKRPTQLQAPSSDFQGLAGEAGPVSY
jgi:hypothetical protein